jgi:hypothetical protein
MGLTEACILNVCASLPALGPLFRLFRAKFGGKSQNTSAMGGSNFNGGVGYSGRATRSTRTRNGWGHLNGIEVHSSIEVLRTPKDMADLKSIEMSPVSRERKSDIDSIV